MNDVLYDKTITCVYCQVPFKTKRMKVSKIKTNRRDTDFCTYFEGENPLFYEFNICPTCGLAFTDSFSPIRGPKREVIKQEYLEKIKVPDACGTRTLSDAIRGYKLALLCAGILNEKNLIQANICMRIAWLNRYENKTTEEHRFLQNAVTIYEEIYQTESMDTLAMEEARLLYLTAELHARLGHYDQTRRWFSYLLTADRIDAKWKSMARDRWYDIKTAHAALAEDPEGYDS